MTPTLPPVLVRAVELERFCTDVLTQHGVLLDDAIIAARAIVEADLRGVHTHGTMLLPSYASKLRSGGINPRPETRTLRETASTVVLDAGNGFGHVIATRAMELAMDRAATAGIAAVGVRNASHFGAAASYSMLAPHRGQIGVATCNTVACMPPTGGLSPRLGNNPISVAVPTRRYPPIVLDMALSTVARGKARTRSAPGRKDTVRLGAGSQRQAHRRPHRGNAGAIDPSGRSEGLRPGPGC